MHSYSLERGLVSRVLPASTGDCCSPLGDLPLSELEKESARRLKGSREVALLLEWIRRHLSSSVETERASMGPVTTGVRAEALLGQSNDKVEKY